MRVFQRATSRPPPLLLRRRLPPLAALVVAILILLIFSVSTLRLSRLLESEKESDLEERLTLSATLIAEQLETPYPPYILLRLEEDEPEVEDDILAVFAETDGYGRLLDRLREFLAPHGLAQILLISPHGSVVLDTSGALMPGDDYPFATIDERELAEAARGFIAGFKLYEVGGVPYMRMYAPVRSDRGVAGILVTAITPDYVEPLRQVRRAVFLQWAFTALALLVIVFTIYRLFAYLVSAERSAMQGLRIESMGALAAGVAHEIRNPLQIIRALAEELAAEADPGSGAARNARDIVAETGRLERLVEQFLSLSRPPEEAAACTIDLREVAGRVAELARKGAPDGLRVETEMPSEPVFVLAAEATLQQILLNLLLNARDAAPAEGGLVRIRLASRRGEAELHVSDNGPGMDARMREHAFEPFFTTKARGTGLGLPITRGLAENLGGSVSIVSEPGQGTDVCVILPLARGA